MTQINVVTEQIIDWGLARKIIQHSTPQAQFLKLVEETGELASSIAKKKPIEETADAIGDIYVVLVMIATMYGLKMEDCIAQAYGGPKGIKDRTGHMTSEGIFVKDE